MIQEKIQPFDEPERLTAISELDKNILVLAGAGTGKTTLLVERLLAFILVKEIPVEKIVALTFTKKAAEEIRERLEKVLRSVIDKEFESSLLLKKFSFDETRWVPLAMKALENVPRAEIGTIHSFAARILRLFPIEAGVDPRFQEDEGNIFDGVFEEAWWSWLSEELKANGARRTLWLALLEKLDLGDLKELGRALSSPEVELDKVLMKVNLKETVRELAGQLDALIKKNGIPAKAPAFARRIEGLRKIFLTEGPFGHGPFGQGPFGPAEKSLWEDVDKLEPGQLPADWKEDPENKTALEYLKSSAKALSQLDDELINRIYEALLPLARKVRKDLKKKGAISFAGLLVFARDLVRDHPLVRYELKKIYSTFLIDEFQDTDPLQGEILFYLAEDPDSSAHHWRKVKLGQGRLFVVGDPKQSIYRFRGADIAAFEEFMNLMLEQNAAKVVLSANFRSHRQILDSVNHIFSRVMKPEAYLQPPYSEIQAGLAGEKREGISFISVDCEKAERKPRSSELREFEAELISDWIKDNVGKPVGGKPLAYRDIALLFRSSYAFDLYVESLKARGIPYLAEGEKTFFKRPEIIVLFNILAVISDPEDKLALVGVLRSPVGGLDDLEITQLAAAGGLDFRRSPKLFKARLGPLYSLLRDLHENSHLVPVAETIRQIFDRTWFLEVTAPTRQGEQALANLTKVQRMAEKWQKEEPLTLSGFVRRFQDFFENEKEEGENPLADSLLDAVKVMTIHKAKGLEFPVVFLPNISAPKGFAQKSGQLINFDWRKDLVGIHLPKARVMNSAMALLQGEIKLREQAEEVRVFYVAMTRARERLFLILRNTADSRRSVFGQLLKGAGARPAAGQSEVTLSEATAPVLTRDWVQVIPAPEKKTPSKEWPNSGVDLIIKNFSAREKELDSLKGKKILLSPSAMMQEPEKLKVQYVSDEEERARAINLGILCHKVLEWWDFGTPRKKIPALLSRQLDRAAMVLEISNAEPQGEAILHEAKDILGGFMESEVYGHLAAAKILGREVPFLFPPDPETTEKTGALVMRGVMDLIYELDNRVVIADYKTNKFAGRNEAEILEHYRPQGEVYRDALAKAIGGSPEFEIISLRRGKSFRVE